MIRRISMILCLALVLSLASVIAAKEGDVCCNPISDDEYLNMIKGDPWIISMDQCCNGKLDGGQISFKRDGTYRFGNGTTGKWYISKRENGSYYIILKNDSGSRIFAGEYINEGIWKWDGIMIRTSDGTIGTWRIRRESVNEVVLKWDGSGFNSQVGARGSVTLTKKGNQVTLEGELTISSPTYGYVRHELPPGFKPVSTDPNAYPFEVQIHETRGDTSNIPNYGGKGVHVRNDNYAGYENGDIWFIEKLNGKYTLRGGWITNDKDYPDVWKNTPGIKIISQ